MQPLTFDTSVPPRRFPAPLQSSSSPARRTVPRATLASHLTASGTWASTLALEQIHVLATHVLARYGAQPFTSIAVTSSLSGEGKTTITLALAQRLSIARKNVLVIDFDLHRSALTGEVGLENVRGVMDAIRDESETGALPIYASEYPRLYVTPCGAAPGQRNIPLPDRRRIAAIIERAKLRGFHFVLVDCPPLVPVADTHVIGEVVDGAIMVIRAHSTPRPIVERAIEEFGRERFFAAVLNRAVANRIPYFRELYGYYRSGKP